MNAAPKSRAAGETREDYVGPDGSWRAPRPEGLARVVAKAGYGSRSHAEAIVRAGRVSVNGVQVKDPSFAVDAASRFELDGRRLVEAPRRYYAFHKPALLDFRPGGEALARYLPAETPGLEPVGRFDPRTTGLVLISNDQWWNAAILTRRRLEREFEVRVQGELGDTELGIILGGMHLHGLGYMRPTEARILTRDAEVTRLRLTLRGGKIRQLRRLFHSLRHEVADLAIIRVGMVKLGGLGTTQVRPLTRAEVQALRLG